MVFVRSGSNSSSSSSSSSSRNCSISVLILIVILLLIIIISSSSSSSSTTTTTTSIVILMHTCPATFARRAKFEAVRKSGTLPAPNRAYSCYDRVIIVIIIINSISISSSSSSSSGTCPATFARRAKFEAVRKSGTLPAPNLVAACSDGVRECADALGWTQIRPDGAVSWSQTCTPTRLHERGGRDIKMGFYLSLYVYMCVYVFIHIHIHIYIYIRTYIYIYIHTYTYIYIYEHIYTYRYRIQVYGFIHR